jgi:protein involved in polysaccharide export with SLBB domain
VAALLLPALSARAQQSLSAPLSGGNGTPVSATAPATVTNSTAAIVPADYRVDTGDLVQIDVARHGDVSRSVRLQADARIRLPRLEQPIAARGKTCAELTDEITRELKTEGKLVLRPGQVTVSVVEMRIRRIFVQGNAGRSGDFDLKNGWRITELYSVIGGVPNPERVTTKIVNPLRPAPLSLNLMTALNNPDSADNVPLIEGDTIIIDAPHLKRLFVKGEGPRGAHELDERFGLRQALIEFGFSDNGATGDLQHSVLIRHAVPGDPNSPETRIPVNVGKLLSDDTTPDIPIQDMDTLDIPISQQYIYVYGETSVPRKIYLPQDRPTYLVDIMSMGGTSSKAKIDDIKIWRMVNGKPTVKSYKFGKFLANLDMKQNPEIKAQDIIIVPDVKRPDVISNVWQAWGLYGIVQTLFPGARP